MEDAVINTLLNEEKYEDAIELMKDKYIGLFGDMLKKKKAQVPENEDFYCYATKMKNEYPNLNFEIDMLRKGILSEDMSILEEIELLKNTYNYIKVNY